MPPQEETREWIHQAARWWIESFGGFEALRASTLLVPTEECFPVDTELEGHALAEDFFSFVLEHAGLSEWPLVLVPEEEWPDVGAILRGMPHHMTSAPVSHTKSAPIAEGDPLPIPYHPRLIAEPIGLVATMARGVSHYLLYEAPTELPGEADDREYFVDLGAVLLGFGVFLANAAFRFEQREEGVMIGWGYSRSGALSELDLSYTLALYAELLELPEREVLRHLRPNPKGFVKDARKHLARHHARDLERLRAIPSGTRGPYR